MSFVFDPQPVPALPVAGLSQKYPVQRIFCVGRNFIDHATEMGTHVDPAAPFYFTKSSPHVAPAAGDVPIAPQTQNYHHEIELVVALGSGGRNIDEDRALSHVFAYAPGLDMTRRDLQSAAKDKRRPWDTAKDVEKSALVAPLRPVHGDEHIRSGKIELRVNGAVRQCADLSEMVWSVEQIIADVSRLYCLGAGDLIFMGTPAGVGPVNPGDVLEGSIEACGRFSLRFF